MGLFRVPMTITGPDAGGSETVAALVDTGASYSMAPVDLLGRLGITPTRQTRVRTADDRIVAVSIGEARLEVAGSSEILAVIFGRPGSRSILGVSALEELEFGVDPIRERLIPGELLAMLYGRPAPGVLP